MEPTESAVTEMMDFANSSQPWPLNHSEAAVFPWPNDTFLVPTVPGQRGRGPPDCSSGLPLMRYICEVVISLPISILGIIGNVLAFIVLCRQKQRLTTTILLQALAIADTMVLVSIVLGRGLRYLAHCNHWTGYMEVFPEIFRWMYPMTYFFRQTDVWLVTLLTIDRWIAVCKPLHAQRLCTLSRAYKEMAAVTLGAMVFTLPRFFEFSLNDKGQIATHWLWRQEVYTIIYRIILFFLFMYLIPMILLMILNTKLLKTLHEADIYRAALRESRNQTTGCVSGFRSITWMVVTVVITCMLCNILAIISHILWSLAECFPELKYLEKYRRYIVQASNIMIAINSAINFVIYCMCSKQFRQSFIRTFCTCPGKKTISGARASKRLSGAPFSSGSGTGLMYISLPQIGDRRKNNHVHLGGSKGGEDVPPTPAQHLLNRVANGSSRHHRDPPRETKQLEAVKETQLESRM